MKSVAFFIASVLSLIASDCALDYKILYGIAEMERHTNRDVGYPYIISFNNKKDSHFFFSSKKKKKEGFSYEKLDNRSIDCLSLENCVKITEFLFANKIINLDLGAFQINSKWHKYETSHYFKLGKSSMIVCEILTELESRKGWSWKTLASYHSSTEHLNRRYGERLKEKIEGY